MASWFLVRIVLFKAFLKGVVTMSCGNPLWTERTSSVYPMKYLWGIERSGFFNGREKWAKGFENQRV